MRPVRGFGSVRSRLTGRIPFTRRPLSVGSVCIWYFPSRNLKNLNTRKQKPADCCRRYPCYLKLGLCLRNWIHCSSPRGRCVWSKSLSGCGTTYSNAHINANERILPPIKKKKKLFPLTNTEENELRHCQFSTRTLQTEYGKRLFFIVENSIGMNAGRDGGCKWNVL